MWVLFIIVLLPFLIVPFLGFLGMTIVLFQKNLRNLKLMLQDAQRRINNRFGYGYYFDRISIYFLSPLFVFIFFIIFSIAYSILIGILFILSIKINIIERYWKKKR
jgi:hypothetical protein